MMQAAEPSCDESSFGSEDRVHVLNECVKSPKAWSVNFMGTSLFDGVCIHSSHRLL